MSYDFPSSPAENQEYTPAGGVTYVYKAPRWVVKAVVAAPTIVPVGTVLDYTGSALPTGFVWPNGQNLSRTIYAALFAVLGTTYGAGDGSTTFGVPDLRGRVAAAPSNLGGVDSGRLTGYGSIAGTTLGSGGGGEYYVQTLNQMAIHNHGITDPTHNHGMNDPTHAHNLADPTHAHGSAYRYYTPDINNSVQAPTGGAVVGAQSAINAAGVGLGVYGVGTGVYNSASGHGAGISNNGANWGTSLMQPTLLLNKILYAGV